MVQWDIVNWKVELQEFNLQDCLDYHCVMCIISSFKGMLLFSIRAFYEEAILRLIMRDNKIRVEYGTKVRNWVIQFSVFIVVSNEGI